MLAIVAVQSDPKRSFVQLFEELALAMSAVQYDPKKTVVQQLEEQQYLAENENGFEGILKI